MIRALYTAASGMLVESRRMDLAARNLYYAQIPGYKATGELRAAVAPPAPGVSTDVQTDYVGEFMDPSPGPVRPTGRALDLALSGDGFFALQTPAGIGYTRDGRFRLDADRVIRSASGDVLLGQGGAMQLPEDLPLTAEIVVEADGTFRADGKVIGRLRLEHFPGYRGLRQAGGNLYFPTGAVRPVPARPEVIQKALEQGNVQIVEQMVRTIEAVRAFESYQRVIQTVMDDVTSAAVQKIGRLA